MNLFDDLPQTGKIALDSAPIIYLIEGHPRYQSLVHQLNVRKILSGNNPAITSVVTLLEVLVKPMKDGNSQKVRQFQSILKHTKNLTLIDVDSQVAEKAAYLRAKYSIRTPDSIQLATALLQDCVAFITNDSKLKRVSEIKVFCLDEYTIAGDRRTIVLGTGNRHKVDEIAPLLRSAGLPVELKIAADFGAFNPDESGSTLEENALIKARAAMELSGEWSIADDTGLFVDALDGRPGIYAARYAGPGCSFADNIKKLLGEMKDVPLERRTAAFACVIALCRPGQASKLFRGECKGSISTEAQGSGGFGYDPVFRIAGLNKTFAELSPEEKNRISHRSIATTLCREELARIFEHGRSHP